MLLLCHHGCRAVMCVNMCAICALGSGAEDAASISTLEYKKQPSETELRQQAQPFLPNLHSKEPILQNIR